MDNFVSVIVPMYNSEMYIERTILSIMNQTINNFEVIVIDDGSIDHSYELVKRLCLKYPNLKLIHQENKGASAARNVGIKMATGNFVTFVDSDDYVPSDYIEWILKNAIRNGIVAFGNFLVTKNRIDEENKFDEIEGPIDKDVYLSYLMSQRINAPWDKIYDLELIKSKRICFDEELTIAEDLLFNIKYSLYTGQHFFCKHANYYHVSNEAGIMSSTKLIKKVSDNIFVFERVQNIKEIEKYKITLVNTIFSSCVFYLKQSLEKDDNWCQAKKIVKEYFSKHYKCFSIKNRIKLFLL